MSGMVRDSLSLRGAVHWYTTMVGKKATLRAVRSLLYRHGVRALRTTEFFQACACRRPQHPLGLLGCSLPHDALAGALRVQDVRAPALPLPGVPGRACALAAVPTWPRKHVAWRLSPNLVLDHKKKDFAACPRRCRARRLAGRWPGASRLTRRQPPSRCRASQAQVARPQLPGSRASRAAHARSSSRRRSTSRRSGSSSRGWRGRWGAS